MTPRKEIHNIISSDLGPSLEGPLEEAIEYLQKIKAQHGPSYYRLDLEWAWEGDYRTLNLNGVRVETDAEMSYRLEREKEAVQNKEAQERLLYHKLHLKYGECECVKSILDPATP